MFKTKYPKGVATVLAFLLVIFSVALMLKLTLLSPTYVKKNIATRENAVAIQSEIATAVQQQSAILPDVEPIVKKVVSENNVTQLLEVSVAHVYTGQSFSTTLSQVKTIFATTLTSATIFGETLSTTITNLVFPSIATYLSDNLEAPLTQAQKMLATASVITTALLIVSGILSVLCVLILLTTRIAIFRRFGLSLAGFSLLFWVINLFFWQNVTNHFTQTSAVENIFQEFLATTGHQFAVSGVVLIIFGLMFFALSFFKRPIKNELA